MADSDTRPNQGLSVSEVARELGRHQSTVRAWASAGYPADFAWVKDHTRWVARNPAAVSAAVAALRVTRYDHLRRLSQQLRHEALDMTGDPSPGKCLIMAAVLLDRAVTLLDRADDP